MDDLRTEEILSKELAGWHQGCPVFAIECKGGRNIVAVMRNGRLEPLGVGPHKVMARAIAKRQARDIKWVELSKADANLDPNSPLFRRYEDLTAALRRECGF